MRAIYSIVGVLSLPLFLYGMECQRHLVNLDMRQVDQHAYIYNAREIAQTNFHYMGDRNRMPAFPSLMALFWKKDMPLEDFFEIGKRVGEVIAILVLLAFFSILKVYARLPDALAATLVVAFTVFAFKAAYFQTEILYYGLSFVFFVLTVALIARPRLVLAVGAGATGGIAYLTKASVPPAIVLCLVCLALLGVAGLRDLLRLRADRDAPRSVSWVSAAAPWYCGLVLALCFLIVVFPYIRQNKTLFGLYFYNVNTTFYMWYDSWPEAKRGTFLHGDMIGWPDMPEDRIPSMRKYLREHTASHIAARFVGGAKTVWRRSWHSYGYVQFLALYAICVSAIALQNRKEIRPWLLTRRNAILAFFGVAYFGGYFLVCAWFAPVGSGTRYALALFLPAMFVSVRFLAVAQKNDWPLLRIAGKRIPAYAVSPAVLVALLAYVAFVFPHRVSTMFGGM